MDRKEQNIAVFQETQKCVMDDPALRASTERALANASVYPPSDKQKGEMGKKAVKVIVSSKKSFQAARDHAVGGSKRKICVLNFACATKAGGGVSAGAVTQEEDLCRCSNLYPVLCKAELQTEYYQMHRGRNSSFYTDTCIYTPDIQVLRDDIHPKKLLPSEKRFSVDVITCAAPNVSQVLRRNQKIDRKKLKRLWEGRTMQILQVAADQGVDVLVLGAFGCGAFGNDPAVVAKAFAKAMDCYGSCFDVVEFAVYHRPDEVENYNQFAEVFAPN